MLRGGERPPVLGHRPVRRRPCGRRIEDMRRSHLGSLPACRKGKVVRDEHCPQFSVGDASIPSNVLQNSFIAVYRSSQLRNTPSNGKICESRQNESRHATPPFDQGDHSWTDTTGKSSQT